MLSALFDTMPEHGEQILEIGETLYVTTRQEWRSWLAKNHGKAREIWLIYYRKASGKARIPYDEAVEEALCYGWIDSIVKPVDEDRYAQRFTPRRAGSKLSDLNRERVRRLVKAKRMTRRGLVSLGDSFDPARDMAPQPEWQVPEAILARLREDPVVWANYQSFPEPYRRVRIGWIAAAMTRPEIFEKRLRYFLKKTARNEKYGSMQ